MRSSGNVALHLMIDHNGQILLAVEKGHLIKVNFK